MSAACVLDSWAVLAYLEGGRGASSLGAAIDRALAHDRAVMSWVNLGEVAYVLQRRFGKQEAYVTVQDLRAAMTVLLPDEALVSQAAEIKASYAMTYADAFAAATAIQWGAPLWTGDPELLIPKAPWRWKDLRN